MLDVPVYLPRFAKQAPQIGFQVEKKKSRAMESKKESIMRMYVQSSTVDHHFFFGARTVETPATRAATKLAVRIRSHVNLSLFHVSVMSVCEMKNHPSESSLVFLATTNGGRA